MEVSKEARSQTVKAAKAVAAAREATMELDKVIYWEKAWSFSLLPQPLLHFHRFPKCPCFRPRRRAKLVKLGT